MTLAVAVALAVTVAGPAGKRFHPFEAAASSSLKSSWNKFEENYLPNYALDDDAKTAWVEAMRCKASPAASRSI